MKFANPEYLLWLWCVIPVIALMILAFINRRRALQQFAPGAVSRELSEVVHHRMRRLQYGMFIVVLIFAVLALARPQWGFELREVHRQGVDILLAVDVSKSMLTKDVAPNRLERTRLAIRDLLEQLKGDRVGLIAFAGEAFTVCPLTSDYGGVLMSLADLDVQSIPRGGTQVSAAIKEAIRVYRDRPAQYKTLVILTDGDNLEGDPVAEARAARKDGMKIYTVGIGTREGELIRIPDGKGGQEFLKDRDGRVVKSRLNEALLQEIALATGGIYVRAGGAHFGLDEIYRREISKLDQTEFEAKMQRRYFERFQWPLSAACVGFIIALVLPQRRRNSEFREGRS